MLAAALPACARQRNNQQTLSTPRLQDWIREGTYSYEYEVSTVSESSSMEATGKIAVQGAKMSIETNIEIQNGISSKSNILIDGDETYMIDHEGKMLYKMGNMGFEIPSGIVVDASGLQKAGEGQGEFEGANLSYEDFEAVGVKMRFYYDGADAVAIVSEMQGYLTTLKIKNASNTVPSGSFDIPEGYLVIEYNF